MKNLYEILEVSETASKEIIEKAYKTLAKKYHPDLQETADKEKAEEMMKKIGLPQLPDLPLNEHLSAHLDEGLGSFQRQGRETAGRSGGKNDGVVNLHGSIPPEQCGNTPWRSGTAAGSIPRIPRPGFACTRTSCSTAGRRRRYSSRF